MVRWICSAKLFEKIPMSDLRICMGISSIEDAIRYNRLRWFGHLQRMDEEKWPSRHVAESNPHCRGKEGQ